MASNKCKLRKDDEIIVVAGRDKGNRGTITKILEDDKLLVSGINMVKKHQRPDPNRNIQGGIIDKEAPIHISNVAIYNSATGKADRVGYTVDDDGKKHRVFKSNGEKIDI